MAKGVKKIKRLSNSYEFDDYFNAGDVICINANQEASFLVGEWYSETTEEERRRNISWLWMDQKKRKIFNQTIKPVGVPYGVTIPRKLCGNYTFYLEVGLYDGRDQRNLGVYAFGKCEKKITSSSWSKNQNTADNSEINYGHDLFISLEMEGVNGDTVTLESYSVKKIETALQTVNAKCINGIVKAKFTTMPWFMAFPGLPTDLENFYIKVLDNEGRYIKSKSGNDKIVSFTIKNKRVMPVFAPPTNTAPLKVENTPKEEEQEKGVCYCKENNFYWSNKLTCDERKKVLEVCAKLWGEDKKKEKASELMSVIHLESGATFSPSADNGVGFSGLIQFSDAAAKGVGTTRSALKRMTFIEQMNYVEKYFEPQKGRLNTMTDLYLLVVKPNSVGNGENPDYVLFDESVSVPDGDGSGTSHEQRMININREPWVTKYGYASNPSFMKETEERTRREKWVYTRQRKEMRWGFHNGKTTVGEVTQELTEKHYTLGAVELFKGECKNVKVEKPENTNGERAPWMKIALEEAKSYGGKDENTIDGRIQTYHKDGGNSPGSGSGTAWCSSFVCWCLEESGNKSPKSAGSRMFLDSKKVEKCDAFYGAVAIFSDCDSTGKKIQTSGHATFVFGELSRDGIYACLGGNQGDMLKISKYDCSGNVFVSYVQKKVTHYKVFRGFYKPIGYEIKEADKLTKDDKYTSADDASKEVLKLNIKSNESGESSR